MFNLGDRVRVYKTNWTPKKAYIGSEYIISDIRCRPDAATTYALSIPADNNESLVGACKHMWFDSELGLVNSKDDIKTVLNSVYGTSYMSTRTPGRHDGLTAAIDAMYAYKTYCGNDIKSTEEMWKMMSPYISTGLPKIKNVIFNDPATIVFWSDNTKTVVKAQNDDVFDPEKGLAMAISKKALGNKGNYCNVLKPWLPEEGFSHELLMPVANEFTKGLIEGITMPIPKLTINAKRINDAINAINKQYDIRSAYEILDKTADNSMLTKTDYNAAVKEALKYLDKALED